VRLARIVGDDSIDELRRGDDAFERGAPLCVGPIEQIDAVEVERIEEEDRRPLAL
jgi:hypothetical protein